MYNRFNYSILALKHGANTSHKIGVNTNTYNILMVKKKLHELKQGHTNGKVLALLLIIEQATKTGFYRLKDQN